MQGIKVPETHEKLRDATEKPNENGKKSEI